MIKNAKVLADTLISFGYHIVSNGTDTHLMLLDLRGTGERRGRVCKALAATTLLKLGIIEQNTIASICFIRVVYGGLI